MGTFDMNEISCPHCKKAFKVDEAGYASILQQVRNSEFEKEIHQRLELAEKDKANAVALANSEADKNIQQAAAAKDIEIQELKTKLDSGEVEKKLAVKEALEGIQKERDVLENSLEQLRRNNQTASKVADAKHSKQLIETVAAKDAEIQTLKANIEANETAKKLAITEAVGSVTNELNDLKTGLEKAELEKQLSEKSLKDKYETQLKDRNDTIDRLKDMKARLSTKMVGETLEQHCETEFNRIRATAFPLAYFEKDNDASTGSKGDYIFKDLDTSDTEIVSIMFEMKNESDTTATKKKNEDFLKELDKDRNQKGCEYAVLVSLLEPDSELYNSGIVDVSHRYSKMYVIRPQFFIPMITLLRNAALKSLEYKTELALIRSQNIDITNFENCN